MKMLGHRDSKVGMAPHEALPASISDTLLRSPEHYQEQYLSQDQALGTSDVAPKQNKIKNNENVKKVKYYMQAQRRKQM